MPLRHGARLVVLPRHLDGEGEHLDAELSLQGPASKANNEPPFVELAYGMMFNAGSMADQVAGTAKPRDYVGAERVSSTDILDAQLVGQRTHYIQRRNRRAMFVRYPFCGRHIACLVMRRPSAAVHGARLLDILALDALSAVIPPQGDAATHESPSFDDLLQTDAGKGTLTTRLEASLAWIEERYLACDAATLPRGLARTGDIRTDRDTAAAARQLLDDASRAHDHDASPCAAPADDSVLRFVMVGGLVLLNGATVAATAGGDMAALMHNAAWRHGLLDGDVAARTVYLHVGQAVAESRQLAAGVAAAVREAARAVGLTPKAPGVMFSAPDMGPATGQIFLAGVARGPVACVAVFAPSRVQYIGVPAARAVGRLAAGADHLAHRHFADQWGQSLSTEAVVLRGVSRGGSALTELYRVRGVQVVAAAVVSAGGTWLEFAPSGAYVAQQLERVAALAKKDVNATDAQKKLCGGSRCTQHLSRWAVAASLHSVARNAFEAQAESELFIELALSDAHAAASSSAKFQRVASLLQTDSPSAKAKKACLARLAKRRSAAAATALEMQGRWGVAAYSAQGRAVCALLRFPDATSRGDMCDVAGAVVRLVA